MARRTVLTSRQRSALFSLRQHETELLRHYTLSDEDLQHIEARRRPRNKLGFALQLCVLRYPGRLLAPGELVPPAVVDFIGRQLDLDGYELADYAVRSETRHEHLSELRRLYGFRSFSGRAARELGDRLRDEAPLARSNDDLARRFVDACRRTRLELPEPDEPRHAGVDRFVEQMLQFTPKPGRNPLGNAGFDPAFRVDQRVGAKPLDRRRGRQDRTRAAIPPTPTGCWTASSTCGGSISRSPRLR